MMGALWMSSVSNVTTMRTIEFSHAWDRYVFLVSELLSCFACILVISDKCNDNDDFMTKTVAILSHFDEQDDQTSDIT